MTSTRWTCHKGHFIAEDTIESEDYLDDAADCGVSTGMLGCCEICGLVENPRITEVGIAQCLNEGMVDFGVGGAA